MKIILYRYLSSVLYRSCHFSPVEGAVVRKLEKKIYLDSWILSGAIISFLTNWFSWSDGKQLKWSSSTGGPRNKRTPVIVKLMRFYSRVSEHSSFVKLTFSWQEKKSLKWNLHIRTVQCLSSYFFSYFPFSRLRQLRCYSPRYTANTQMNGKYHCCFHGVDITM
jgi:hypothetical protein